MDTNETKELTAEELKQIAGGGYSYSTGVPNNMNCPTCNGGKGGTTITFTGLIRVAGVVRSATCVRCTRCSRAWIYGDFPVGQIQYRYIVQNTDQTYSVVY